MSSDDPQFTKQGRHGAVGEGTPAREAAGLLVQARGGLFAASEVMLDSRNPFPMDWDSVVAVVCFVALTVGVLLYGLMQERIMTTPFGADNRHFSFSVVLVLINRTFTCLCAASFMLVRGLDMQPLVPISSYSIISFANSVSSYCQYEALMYISYPVATLAKCAKMVPVMVWGTLIGGKRYSSADYLQAAAVCAGALMFVTSGPVGAPHHRDFQWGGTALVGFGAALLVAYLAFDGLTSTWQDRLYSGVDMHVCNQVFYTTLCSCGLTLLSSLSTGQLFEAVLFFLQHPFAFVQALQISCVATFVQFFISYVIKRYGALTFASIMTTRQFLSILLSCYTFGHAVTPLQGVGVIVVFAALYHRARSRSSKKASRRPADARPHGAARPAKPAKPAEEGAPRARSAEGPRTPECGSGHVHHRAPGGHAAGEGAAAPAVRVDEEAVGGSLTLRSPGRTSRSTSEPLDNKNDLAEVVIVTGAAHKNGVAAPAAGHMHSN